MASISMTISSGQWLLTSGDFMSIAYTRESLASEQYPVSVVLTNIQVKLYSGATGPVTIRFRLEDFAGTYSKIIGTYVVSSTTFETIHSTTYSFDEPRLQSKSLSLVIENTSSSSSVDINLNNSPTVVVTTNTRSYPIEYFVSPLNTGTCTGPNSATADTTVTFSASPNNGYSLIYMEVTLIRFDGHSMYITRYMSGVVGQLKTLTTADSYTEKIRITAYFAATPTNPTTVSRSLSGSTVTVSWSGATAGTNNSITGYKVIRNTSASETNAVQINLTTATSITDTPGPGTFYYGVQTQGSISNASGYKWSSSIAVTGKPSVSAGTIITKESMDALRVYIQKGTAVTKFDTIKASVGTTYYPVSANAPVAASWFNAAAG